MSGWGPGLTVGRGAATTQAAVPPARRRASGGRSRRLLFSLLVVYLGSLALLALGDAIGPEQADWSALLLYLPRWPLALPALLLFLPTWRQASRVAPVLLAALAWVLGPAAGFRWSAGKAPVSGRGLRVMTYNAGWAAATSQILTAQLEAEDLDLLLVQDMDGDDEEPGPLPPGYSWSRAGNMLMVTRLPLVAVDYREYPVPGLPDGYQRGEIRLGGRNVVVYNVHLLTPRGGLRGFRHAPFAGTGLLRRDTQVRLAQSSYLARCLAGEREPVILGGDLNAPPQSLIPARIAGKRLQNAFDVAGWGYGFTFGQSTLLRHPFLRLDHLFADRRFTVLRCRTGNNLGSDHRPVIADLAVDW